MSTQSRGPNDERTDGLELDDTMLQEIVTFYCSQIVIPDKKSVRVFLLCPIGKVGAGKTTVLKPLANKLGLVRVSSDEIRMLLLKRGYNFVRTREIAFQLICEFLQKGYGVAVDADCAGEPSGSVLKKTAERYQAPLVWIHINPPEEFIVNKLKNIDYTWGFFKDANDALASYERRKPLHKELDYPFVYVFDTSRNDLEKQIEEAVIRITSQT